METKWKRNGNELETKWNRRTRLLPDLSALPKSVVRRVRSEHEEEAEGTALDQGAQDTDHAEEEYCQHLWPFPRRRKQVGDTRLERGGGGPRLCGWLQEAKVAKKGAEAYPYIRKVAKKGAEAGTSSCPSSRRLRGRS